LKIAMSSEIKPIKVWGTGGPNPPKVAILLEELGIPYEAIPIAFEDLKKPDFLAINPNGRMPAIHDPNIDLTLWESGAIIEYLIECYDKTQKLSFAPGSTEAYHAKQWLFYQVSGQGPYYGQAVWFKRAHPERLPSAVERYLKEIGRVTAVLEGHLAKQKADADNNGPWMVGSRMSFVDLALFSWQNVIMKILDKTEYNPEDYPIVTQWVEKMASRESVKTVMARAQH
jgi:glutathione S-transferase